MPRYSDRLSKERKKIARLDLEMLALLNERAAIAAKLGDLKRQQKVTVYDPTQEKQVLKEIRNANKGPLPPESVASIFSRIIHACRNLQQRPRVGSLGPSGTFSHQAANVAFGEESEVLTFGSFTDVAQALARHETDHAVLPIENSIEGVVGGNLDLVAEYGLTVTGEVIIPIELYLTGRGKPESVTEVYSHPQALQQARHWLREHLPNAELVPVASTAEGARLAAKKKRSAAVVGPLVLGEATALAGPIQDRAENRTRFWVLGHRPKNSRGNKTSLLLTLTHQAGSLADALLVFAQHKLNLTSIVSRPVAGEPWQYRFFIDIEGSRESARYRTAMAALESSGVRVQWLGTYQAAAEPA